MTPYDRHDQAAHEEAESVAPAPGHKPYAAPGLLDFGPLRTLTQGGATAVAGDILPHMRKMR